MLQLNQEMCVTILRFIRFYNLVETYLTYREVSNAMQVPLDIT